MDGKMPSSTRLGGFILKGRLANQRSHRFEISEILVLITFAAIPE